MGHPVCGQSNGQLFTYRTLSKVSPDIERALTLDPNHALALYITVVLKSEPGHTSGALENTVERLIALKPTTAEDHVGRSLGLSARGDFKNALVEDNQAITLDPQSALAYARRANDHLAMGDIDGYYNDINKAVEIAPNFAMYHVIRAMALLDLKQLDQALLDCDKAVELANAFPWGYEQRGQVYEAKKNYAAAQADFDTALKLDPISARAHAGRGRVLAAQGRFADALTEFDIALAIAPSMKDVRFARDDVLMRDPSAQKDFARDIQLSHTKPDVPKQNWGTEASEQVDKSNTIDLTTPTELPYANGNLQNGRLLVTPIAH